MDSAASWKNVSDVLEDLTSEARDILVFVHGFNVTFEEAALRAAQIACNLQFPGTAAFFSWPSKGSPDPFSYSADGESVEKTAKERLPIFSARAPNKRGRTGSMWSATWETADC